MKEHNYKLMTVKATSITGKDLHDQLNKYDYECLMREKIYFCFKPFRSISKRHVGIVTNIIYPKNIDDQISIEIYSTPQVEEIINKSNIHIRRTQTGFLYFYIHSNQVLNLDLKDMEMSLIKYYTDIEIESGSKEEAYLEEEKRDDRVIN